MIDWIQFDSGEEAECYVALRDWKLWTLTWIKELNKWKLLDAQPKSIELYPSFKAWSFLQRARKYTRDFTCLDENGIEVHLEYKSVWSEKKPDYRLRRFLVLLSWKLRFVELVKIRKWIYELKRYF